MNAGRTHVCTLCNRSFEILPDAEVRCPHCLRVTGVVATDGGGGACSPGWMIPWRKVLIAAAAVVVAAGLVFAVWRLFDAVFDPDPYTLAEADCRDAGALIPWEKHETWGRSFSQAQAGTADADAFAALAEHLRRDRGVVLLPPGGRTPDRISTGRELSEQGPRPITSVEAVAYLLGCALAADLDVAPCLEAGETPDVTTRLHETAYALCRLEGDKVVETLVPFGDPGNREFLPVSPPQFAAHLTAAAAEVAGPAPLAYQLFGAALQLMEDPGILFARGLRKIAANAVEFGVDDLRRALSLSDSARGRTVLADTLLSQGLAQNALAEFERALALDPAMTEARLGRIRTLLALRETVKAGELLSALEKESPDLSGLHTARARWHLLTGERDKAIAQLDAEIKAHPDQEVYYTLWTLLMEEGEEKEAARILEQGVERFPDAPPLALALYYMRKKTGDGAAAAAVKEKAVTAVPEGFRKRFGKMFDRIDAELKPKETGKPGETER